MSNSYRIKTTPGVDTSVNVRIDQDFEYLEILSLKLLQSEVYTRKCSDYGVIVGRVSINNGFGVPNAKVSLFVPLTSEDEANNPIISSIYPYKTLSQVNEEGYRYNLLPKEPSYSNHVPTGSFLTKQEILTNPYKLEVYEKYYKYNAVTNESGDYMIFGVPLGSQTIVVNVDLSDIGEFSLSPQDLLRMGAATSEQVDGDKFKSSENINELPQIITITRTLEVEPLWGDETLCQIGITRTDFDLSAEKNITIQPTAIFMGSIFSSSDDNFQKTNCKPSFSSGELCELSTGPGEILAIRQTINVDSNGRPILEQHVLQNNGQVIDENGTWLVDVPMNLDYVTTNEFGARVLSNDPKSGIPTRGKYRFKVKWNQSPKLSEPIKRAYFLVPNVKEYGWINSSTDPISNPTDDFKNSYAFSLDWNDYGKVGTVVGDKMILEAINCEDRFYDMTFNKVYTVSELITQYRNGYLNSRFISVKNILDSSCSSENNKFPTNDAYFRFDIIYILFVILSYLLKPVLYVLIILMHIVAFILEYLLLPIVLILIGYATYKITLLGIAIGAAWPALGLVFPFGLEIAAWGGVIAALIIIQNKAADIKKVFTDVKIPNLTYPDCQFCDCDGPSPPNIDPNNVGFKEPANQKLNKISRNTKGTAILSKINSPSSYLLNMYSDEPLLSGVISGQDFPAKGMQTVLKNTNTQCLCEGDVLTTFNQIVGSEQRRFQTYSNDLPVAERLNLFNLKAKYFDSSNNPGGGVNRIKVKFFDNLNPGPNQFHLDNVMVLIIPGDFAKLFATGQMITFQDSKQSTDINLSGKTQNQYGTYSIEGTPKLTNTKQTVRVTYANPDGTSGTNLYADYDMIGNTDNQNGLLYKFPIDIEYFQVIKTEKITEYRAKCDVNTPNTMYHRVFGFGNQNKNIYIINRHFYSGNNGFNYPNGIQGYSKPFSSTYSSYSTDILVYLVRGVDPNSPRVSCTYDLNMLYGKQFGSDPKNIVKGNFKLNIPIKGTFKNVKHNTDPSNIVTVTNLYFPSYHFKPNVGDMRTFNSPLPRFYSALDSETISTNTLYTNYFKKSITKNQYVNYNANFSRRVRFGFQVFAPVDNQANYSTTNRLNYFVSEKIEGGSALYFNVYKTTRYNEYSTDPPSWPGTLGYDFEKNIYPWLADSVYICPVYVENKFTYNPHQNIVMRSDRLPMSTFMFQPDPNDSFAGRPLHANPNFEVFFIDDTGNVKIGGSPTSGGDTGGNKDVIPIFDNQTQTVLNTLQCQSLIPITCYDYNAKANRVEIVDPVKGLRKTCYTNEGTPILVKGCYVFVTNIFTGLGRDLELLREWQVRLNLNFAACRNVFSHTFTNNWINGTLYAFSFKNNVTYDTQLNPINNFCNDTIYFDKNTNNFYYRSSPYSNTSGFIGKTNSGSYGGNKKYLLYPTTIIDLGPRSEFLQEIMLSDDYDGYVLNRLNNTSYNDVSELLVYTLTTRMINYSVAKNFSDLTIFTFFRRSNNSKYLFFMDGDYTQSLSVNSEIGISGFDESVYTNQELFVNFTDDDNSVLGVFYKSDLQTKDWISPKRTIINGDLNSLKPCAFNKIPVKTQIVPFYQWTINPSTNIFGTKTNDWSTNPTEFFSYGYQSMDRVLSTSKYFRTKNNNKSNNLKGYIYGLDTKDVLSADVKYWDKNPDPNDIVMGAPFHFYFGLKKGKSAFDRFVIKWVDTNKIVN